MRQAGMKFGKFGCFVEAILVLSQEDLRSNEVVVVLIVWFWAKSITSFAEIYNYR